MPALSLAVRLALAAAQAVSVLNLVGLALAFASRGLRGPPALPSLAVLAQLLILSAAPAALVALARRRTGGGATFKMGGALGAWAMARAAGRPRAGELLLKWVLFPVLPIALLFRVHQVIAFGGPFGEWQLRGAAFWLRSLAAYGTLAMSLLVLLGVAARLVAEALALIATMALPGRARAIRGAAEWLCRAAYFGGVASALALRFLD